MGAADTATPAEKAPILQTMGRALKRYMDLLLLGCFEWHLRLGFQASQGHTRLLKTFPGRKQWLQQRRCTVWALLDTTAVFLIYQYVRRLSPDRALLSVVVATICHNSWKVMLALFGDAGGTQTTALQIARLHASAAEATFLSPLPEASQVLVA